MPSLAKTIVVHDWLYTYAGSERVLESILRCVPAEKIYTLVDFLNKEERFFLNNLPVEHSFLQNMPWARAKRRLYLPLMPLAIESFDLSSADLLISSSMAVAKGILTHSEQLHICYCHSPARYAWDLTHQYLHEADLERGFKAALARMVLHYIRLWDISAANRVDHFIANSKYISRRIWRVYRRESTVIYPPVDVDRFKSRYNKEEFYLTVSRVVPYKKVDLIVETFAQTKKKLIVVGEGPDLKQIKGKATSNIEFLGYQPNDIVEDILQRARAFIFAADEDFGIVAVEAQASGTPVIAYGHGGALETVNGVFVGIKPAKGTTGIFFREQTPQSLSEAINWFEQVHTAIDPAACRQHVERFSRQRFEHEFKQFVESKWKAFQADQYSGGRHD